jgi:hypothetical protein
MDSALEEKPTNNRDTARAVAGVVIKEGTKGALEALGDRGRIK